MFIHRIFSSADQRLPEGPIGCNTSTRAPAHKTNKLINSSLRSRLLFHSSTSPLSLIRDILIASTESLTSKLGHPFTYLHSFAYQNAEPSDPAHAATKYRWAVHAHQRQMCKRGFFLDEGFTQSRYVDSEIGAEIYAKKKKRAESVKCDPQQRDGQTDRRGFGNERIWREKRKNNNSLSLPPSFPLSLPLCLSSLALPPSPSPSLCLPLSL